MSIKKIIKILLNKDDTDRKVERLYKDPIEKAGSVDDSFKEMNKLLYNKTITYYFARAMGVI